MLNINIFPRLAEILFPEQSLKLKFNIRTRWGQDQIGRKSKYWLKEKSNHAAVLKGSSVLSKQPPEFFTCFLFVEVCVFESFWAVLDFKAYVVFIGIIYDTLEVIQFHSIYRNRKFQCKRLKRHIAIYSCSFE